VVLPSTCRNNSRGLIFLLTEKTAKYFENPGQGMFEGVEGGGEGGVKIPLKDSTFVGYSGARPQNLNVSKPKWR
jgi:hypothetical protein